MTPAGLTCLHVVVALLRVQPSANSGEVSVVVSPSRTQFFEYEKVLVGCEGLGSTNWRLWRSTADSPDQFLSWCGSDWGRPTSSGCELSVVKPSDSGWYWCESRHRDGSNSVNITVTRSPVLLQSPVGPLKLGQDVTLRCKTNDSVPGAAHFLRHTLLVGTSPAGHITLRNFSWSDEGVYSCRDGERRESPPSWLLMDGSWGAASPPASPPASLSVRPSSAQVLEYQDLAFSCGNHSRSPDWAVVRATGISDAGGKLRLQMCGRGWGVATATGCLLRTSKRFDSGIYWCQSPRGRCSNAVNISVHNTRLILEGLLHPLEAGDNATLLCRSRDSSSSAGPALFYREQQLIGSAPSGLLHLLRVSSPDEGWYWCHLRGHGDSPASFLSVRAPGGAPPSSGALLQLRVGLHLVVVSPYCVSTVVLLLLCLNGPTEKPSVSMTTPSPSEEDEQLAREEGMTANVAIEHDF